MAFSGGKNPFMDDPDDFSYSRNRGSSRGPGYDDHLNPFGQDRGSSRPYDESGEEPAVPRLEQLMQQSMNRQLDSTHRCLASIYDSEQIGIATAEELVRQGEQLDNIEQKVDKINADTKVSQRHLNNIKSIFGGIKNWWSGEGKNDTPAAPSKPDSRSGLRQIINSPDPVPSTGGTHPGLRNVAGFYDEDIVEFGSSGTSRVKSGAQSSANSAGGTTQNQVTGPPKRSAQWEEYEKNLNANLSQMSTGVSQLKNLATSLGTEIEAQNDQIDRIAPKVDRADTKIRDQNRQMRQILGK